MSHNFPVGAEVFVKPPDARCTSQWSHGIVTGHGREKQMVEIDGLPRHVSHVRLMPSEEESPRLVHEDGVEEQIDADVENARPVRIRRRLAWQEDYCFDFRNQEEV